MKGVREWVEKEEKESGGGEEKKEGAEQGEIKRRK